MRSYEPQKLVEISRYQDYFPTLSAMARKDSENQKRWERNEAGL